MASSDQFKVFWNALGINQKVTIIMSLIGVVALMGAMLWWASQPRFERLAGGLSEGDLAEVVTLLKGKNVDFKQEGDAIFVPAGMKHELRAEVISKGAITKDSVGLEIFDQGNFGVSDFVQRTNKTRALQGELQRSIETIEGIRSARVHIVEKEDKLILQPYENQPTASVIVDTGGRTLDNSQVVGIRNLVAFAIEGLSPMNVAVTDNRGHDLSARVSETGELAVASSQMKYKRQVEEEYRQKIVTLLAPVYGVENLTVGVNVDVETTDTEQYSRTFDPESAVARSIETEREKSKTEEIQQDPIVGEALNTPTGLGGQVGNAPDKSESSSSRDAKKENYEISETVIRTNRKPGTPTEITASVIVNSLAASKAGSEAVAAGTVNTGDTGFTQDQLQKIHDQVFGVLGSLAQGKITVGQAPFVATHETVQADIGSLIRKWFDDFKGPIVVLLAVVMFFIFMRMVKNHKPAITPIEVLKGDDEDEALVKANVGTRPTPELLNELIQQKPDNVAQALKSWSSIK